MQLVVGGKLHVVMFKMWKLRDELHPVSGGRGCSKRKLRPRLQSPIWELQPLSRSIQVPVMPVERIASKVGWLVVRASRGERKSSGCDCNLENQLLSRGRQTGHGALELVAAKLPWFVVRAAGDPIVTEMTEYRTSVF